jgi:hypothetical protein
MIAYSSSTRQQQRFRSGDCAWAMDKAQSMARSGVSMRSKTANVSRLGKKVEIPDLLVV